EIAHGDLIAVRQWGRASVDHLYAMHQNLVAAWDPVETMCRFRVLRSTFFDFDALELPVLHEGEANVVIRYHMGKTAEEAATHQTMGFFERLLELAGASAVSSRLLLRSWVGDHETRVELQWLTMASPA